MALYYYDKYEMDYNESAWSSGYTRTLTSDYQLSIHPTTYTSYSLDTVNGEFNVSGAFTQAVGGTDGAQHEGNYRTEDYNGYADNALIRFDTQTSYSTDSRYGYGYFDCSRKVVNRDRGTFIETIVAEEGTYPTNGEHTDGYWYVKGSLLTPNAPSNVSVPAQVDGFAEISWDASTDGGQVDVNELRYNVEITTDGGSTWQTLVATTAYGATSTVADFASFEEVSDAQVRVRAYDGTSYSDWSGLSNTFAIVHSQVYAKVNGSYRKIEIWQKQSGTYVRIDASLKVNGSYIDI